MLRFPIGQQTRRRQVADGALQMEHGPRRQRVGILLDPPGLGCRSGFADLILFAIIGW